LDTNHFFGRTYCINLDRRPDRWSLVQTQFDRHGIDPVIRFPAIDGQHVDIPETWNDVPGAYGCLLSHLTVVRAARDTKVESVLIFEDDVRFDERFAEKFAEIAPRVPRDWDMLLLGGSQWSPPETLSANLCRAVATAATHAYALRHTIYDEYIRLNGASSRPVDCNNTILQRTFQCYCCFPNLVWQEDGYSDIAGKVLEFRRPGGPGAPGDMLR
jgi:glycosyl transferase, family 25